MRCRRRSSKKPRRKVANLTTLMRKMKASGVKPSSHWQEAAEHRFDRR